MRTGEINRHIVCVVRTENSNMLAGFKAMLNKKVAEALDSAYQLSVTKLFHAIVDGYSVGIQVFAVAKKLLN